MSGTPETIWAFDPHVQGIDYLAGRAVIRPNDSARGVTGGVSYLGPQHPAITVDLSVCPDVYRRLAVMAQNHWANNKAEPPRLQLIKAVMDTVAEALPMAPEAYTRFVGRTANRGVVDLGQIIDAGVGDGRSQALAAGFLMECLSRQRVCVDQNVICFPGQDGGFPEAWARYRDLDALQEDYLDPLATVIMNPANGIADTLWSTWQQHHWSPYARPDDVARLEALYAHQTSPVVRDMIAELGSIASTERRSGGFLR